jgi:cytoskeleton protein RodZ
LGDPWPFHPSPIIAENASYFGSTMNTSQMDSFGSWLRQERERRRITLEDISISTKIRIHFLEAMEQDHLDHLPGGIIGCGFVRAYANYIGINGEDTVAAYLATRGPRPPQPVPEPKTVVKATRLSPWVLAAGFLAMSCGLVALGELRQHYEWFRESSDTPVFTTGSLQPASQTSGVKEARSTDAPGSEELAPEDLATNSALQQQGGFSSVTASPTLSESEKLTLVITVRQDAWMSVIADGLPVLSETLVAPTERSVEAHSHIVVRAGNIGAVDFSFNGNSLPTQGGYGEAKTLSFDAHGLQTRFPKVVSPGEPAEGGTGQKPSEDESPVQHWHPSTVLPPLDNSFESKIDREI